jgi:hypothetical protein
MTTVELTDTQLEMLKECLVAASRSNPALYPTVELLISVILEAEQNGKV